MGIIHKNKHMIINDNKYINYYNSDKGFYNEYNRTLKFVSFNEDTLGYENIFAKLSNDYFEFTIKIQNNKKMPQKLAEFFFLSVDIKYRVTLNLLPDILQSKKHLYYSFKVFKI